MPMVREHNLTHRSEGHVASEDWPEDCVVQWGGSGLVIRKEGGSYGTAFFEAFPEEGGFFRGEGKTIAEAEKSCLEKYTRFAACEHAWSRKGYTNGGAICRNCGAFNSVFAPIVKLGSWKEPLEASTLDLVAEGAMRPDPEDARSHRYHRRSWLKARRMGIDLPDFGVVSREMV